MFSIWPLFLVFISQAYPLSLRVTDFSENKRVYKLSLLSNRVKGLKLGDKLLFSVNFQTVLCEGLVRNLTKTHLTIYVENIQRCRRSKQRMRRGTRFVFDTDKLESREIEAELTRKEILFKKRDFINQMNDLNIYLYNFELRRKKIEEEYNKRIKALKLEKIKALDDLFEERKVKSDLQLKLKVQIERLEQANQYYK